MITRKTGRLLAALWLILIATILLGYLTYAVIIKPVILLIILIATSPFITMYCIFYLILTERQNNEHDSKTH